MVLTVVAAALKNDKGEVLIQRRPEHKQNGGLWEFPGGKVELNETPEMALGRELKEELDINVNINLMKPCAFVTHSKYSGKSFVENPKPSKSIESDSTILLLLYEIEHWYGKIAPQEGQPCVWVSRETILDYALTSADIPLLANIWKEEPKHKPQFIIMGSHFVSKTNVMFDNHFN
jgi:8-oxo-dGTP diphosphatase